MTANDNEYITIRLNADTVTPLPAGTCFYWRTWVVFAVAVGGILFGFLLGSVRGADIGTGQAPPLTVAKPAPPPKAKPVAVRSVYVEGWHVIQAGERTRPGWHWHRSPSGLWLQHGPEHNGNRASHTDPDGNVIWQKAAAPCPPGVH